MTDVAQAVQIDKDAAYRVSLSADTHSFNYDIRLYPPDGAGGFKEGRLIGSGDNAHSQWIGTGTEIEGALVQICAGHGGDTATSLYDIIVQLERERGPGIVEDLHTWKILRGLTSGESRCMVLQFE
jgi:hypothetical protein